MLPLKQRLRMGGCLLALAVAALLLAARPSPVRGDQIAGFSAHNLENHQFRDSRKCLLTAAAALGCVGSGGGGKRTVAMTKRHADKRQTRGEGASSDRDNDVGPNGNNFDYNNYDGGGGGGGGADGGGQDGGPEAVEDYYDPPLITDPRDRMLPVIYNPRPVYVPPLQQVPPPPHQQPQHHQQRPQQHGPPSQYNRYNEDVAPRISPFEVPIIECPPTEDGFERFACPTPDKEGRFRCIDDHVLCDGYIDCPNGDDEDRKNCFFFKTTKAHLDILADALLRWARGR